MGKLDEFLAHQDPYVVVDTMHHQGQSAADILRYLLGWGITNLGYICILLWKHYRHRISDLLVALLEVLPRVNSETERIEKCLRALNHADLRVVREATEEIVATLLGQGFLVAEIYQALITLEPGLTVTELADLARRRGWTTAAANFLIAMPTYRQQLPTPRKKR